MPNDYTIDWEQVSAILSNPHETWDTNLSVNTTQFHDDMYNTPMAGVPVPPPLAPKNNSCSKCGCEIDSNYDNINYTTTMGTRLVMCMPCAQKFTRLRRCPVCNDYHTSSSSYCFHCAKKTDTCEGCGGKYRAGSLQTRHVSVYGSLVETKLCGMCSNNLYTCNRCEGIFPRYEVSREHSDGPLCYSCHTEKTGQPWKRNHDYMPYLYVKGMLATDGGVYPAAIFNYIGKSKRGLYFGVENETVVYDNHHLFNMNPSRIMVEMNNIIKRYGVNSLYLKHDGTIGGEPAHGSTGFEIVLQPHTFKALKSEDWSGLFSENTLRHKSCGMHIHMTKAAFTTLHLYKFLSFIYYSKGFIERVGERKLTKYCTPNHPGHNKRDAKIKWLSDKGPDDIYRRQAVNLCNKDTVELRFFANANTKETFMKNIEFAHALYLFSLDTSLSAFKATKTKSLVSLFCKFVATHKLKYDNLHSFLESQKKVKATGSKNLTEKK